MESESVNDDIRLIVITSINKNTILYKIYKNTCSIVRDSVGNGVWVERSKVVDAIVEKISRERQNIKARLKDLYKNNYAKNYSKTSKGLFMKKENGKVFLKVC